jgi:hypothetical protein
VKNGVVTAPKVSNYEMLRKGDFKKLQIFPFIGLKSDWFFSKRFKATVDLRLAYTLVDNRSRDYLNSLNGNKTIYDYPGKRRDVVGNITLGMARYFGVEKKERDRKAAIKKNTTRYVPPKKLPKPPEKKSRLPH